MHAASTPKVHSSGRLRVLLIDDHPVVLAGLKSFLREDSEVEVAGVAGNVEEAKDRAPKVHPDVFLLIVTSRPEAVSTTRALHEAFPEIAVVILNLGETPIIAAELSEAGASSLLERTSGRDAVLGALHALKSSDDTGPRKLATRAADHGSSPPPSSGSGTLSRRELQVLTLIAEGYTNKQIADELGISVRTVETHRERLMRKLDVQGTAALTKAAIALGLVNARD